MDIIYSDKFINVFSTIVYVENEEEIEKCINCIKSNNVNVEFFKVIFSKEKNQLYFYTNSPIDTTCWKNNTNKKLIDKLIEIFNTLKIDNEDETIINLSNVFKVYSEYYNFSKEKINYLFSSTLKNPYYKVKNYFYDAGNDILKFSSDMFFQEFFVCKEGKEIYVEPFNDYLMRLIVDHEDKIKEIFDIIEQNKFMYNKYIINYKSIIIEFLYNNITIYSKYNERDIFKIVYDVESQEIYNYSNSNIICFATKYKEKDILNKIYLNIKDFPICMQEKLYSLRKQDLYNNNSVSIDNDELLRKQDLPVSVNNDKILTKTKFYDFFKKNRKAKK